ncbi:MAG: RNA polymerase sigma factor RpoD/SigA [Lentisphaeraceae bacterium]|nr:RNA polymerase sigma factor RpoD/SigA [Lentisphaeraceae bacterium]
MDIHVNSVKTYMGEIASYPLVSRNEEVELAGEIADGSDDARRKLTEGNLRLVVKIAHDYKNLGVPLADLIAEGNVGLMKAVSKFKPDKGAKFSSYAAWWIKQAIRRAIANQSRVVRVPVQAAAKMKLIRQTSVQLTKKLGYVPTEKDIAKELGMTERSIRSTIATVNTSLISMDAELQEGEGGTVGDLLTDAKSDTPEDIMEKGDVISLLKDIVETQLNEREQTIIRMRYGFDDGKPKTLEEVSMIIGRTRERVRQIQHQALKKLKINIGEADLSSMVTYAYSSNN